MAQNELFAEDSAASYPFASWFEQNMSEIAGIDEAGRGPLAGPVVAAAVVLTPDVPCLAQLGDSKKLSEKARNDLYDRILSEARAVGVGVVGPKAIDDLNILKATLRAMRQAFEEAEGKGPGNIHGAIVDGNQMVALPDRVVQHTLVKGDAKCPAVMAASIIAKVTRDRMMEELDVQFPQYGFGRHKGYGTKAHLDALQNFGPCEQHRFSFKPVRDAEKNCEAPHPTPTAAQALGETGENLAAKYLQQKGVQLVTRNFRAARGEIDLIGLDDGILCFVEVKTQKSEEFKPTHHQVNRKKQQVIERTAALFLKKNPNFQKVPCRYDIVAVVHGAAQPDIKWHQAAFSNVLLRSS